MSINLSLFGGQSGNYTPIAQSITSDDAIAFASIYEAVKSHAESSRKISDPNTFYTLQEYINQGICVALDGYSLAAIATLKTVGVIASSDNIHIGITLLGAGFYEFINSEA